MIKIYLNGLRELDYDSSVFPAGEIHVRLHECTDANIHVSFIQLFCRVDNSNELMKLFLLTDALRATYENVPINLIIPYLPYARQDRRCNKGEAFSLKVICDMINSQNYQHVVVYDVHSGVAENLLKNCVNFNQYESWHTDFITRKENEYILVSPDKGALSKVKELAEISGNQHCHASKTRDSKTGKLSSPSMNENDLKMLNGKDVVIVDDICDGGGTFIQLADYIKEHVTPKSLILCVTHGIFSKGFDELGKRFDKIVTTDSIRELSDVPKFVDVYKII